MATEALKKFAEELKIARESKEISLQQIANKTRIDIKFLNAIESANFDILPEIYIKAFIKEYANLVELDPKEVINKYEFARTGRLDHSEQIKPITTNTEPEKSETLQLSKFDSTEPITQLSSIDENRESTHSSSTCFYKQLP